MSLITSTCSLCKPQNERLIWQNQYVRIIKAGDHNYPAYTRVIWQSHVQEMTDLTPLERDIFMSYVYLVEQVQREHFKPQKINLAQFGTMVPHLHWHIIPRHKSDLHYPSAIWASPNLSLQQQSDTAYQQFLNEQITLTHAYQLALIKRLKNTGN